MDVYEIVSQVDLKVRLTKGEGTNKRSNWPEDTWLLQNSLL